MNLLAHVLAMTLAQAQPVPSVPPVPQQTGVTISAGVGVGVTGSHALDYVSKSLPFTLAAGYRFNPRWSADLNLTYAPIVLTDSCPDAGASDTRFGAALRWHPSQRLMRPWLSLGLGYEKFRQAGGGCTDVEKQGFDLDFQVGGDVRVSSSWTVGPFASARVGTYVHRHAQNHDRSGAGGPTDETISAGDLTRHEWFSIGLRGTFDSATTTASAESADYHSGLLFMPFLGVHRPAGDSFGLGFRLGLLAGYRVRPVWSVNGELAVDFMNVNNAPDLHSKAYVGDLVLAPLYHLHLARGEIVVGPRLGGFRLSMTDGSGQQQTAHGLAYGLNVGVFGTVGDMALGTLLGYTRRYSTGTGLFGREYLDWNGQRAYQSWSAPDVLSVTFAAMF